MGKKKKRFITKQNTTWKIIDTVFFIGVFIYSSRFIFISWDEFIDVYVNSNDIMVHILWTVFMLFLSFFISTPYILLYFGLRWGIKKYNRSRVTFDVETDLEYYREIFNGINPATISLLMDLSLENRKDLGAMKLYYELNNIYLYEKDGTSYLNNPNNIKLNKSDEILLNYLYKGKNDVLILNEWKENVICENVNNNLIRRKNKEEKRKIGCGMSIFSFIISLVVLYLFVLIADDFVFVMDEATARFADNISILNFIASNPDYIYSFVIGLLLILVLFACFWGFIAGIVHYIVGNSVAAKDKIKRTSEGNALAEKLYGMKNFIRDFSNLDEATKKHLVLWKEFLIYAVTLEENDIVLKEISNLYNTDLLSYKHYKN